jgi:hypothetical protein
MCSQEREMMKMLKMLLRLLAVVIVLTTLSTSTYATSGTSAEGLWRYQPFIVDMRLANGNTFLTTVENGEWTGTFSGTSTEDGKVVIHSSGAWAFRGTVSFEGEVNGRWGKLTMHVVGKRPDVFTDWTGEWVILSGTDDLITLRGKGTWWGPGAPEVGQWGDIYYSGKVHFDPD